MYCHALKIFANFLYSWSINKNNTIPIVKALTKIAYVIHICQDGAIEWSLVFHNFIVRNHAKYSNNLCLWYDYLYTSI